MTNFLSVLPSVPSTIVNRWPPEPFQSGPDCLETKNDEYPEEERASVGAFFGWIQIQTTGLLRIDRVTDFQIFGLIAVRPVLAFGAK